MNAPSLAICSRDILLIQRRCKQLQEDMAYHCMLHPQEANSACQLKMLKDA